MSTILYSSPIFGPVKSRRLGISLGVNLMPADGKLCSFDCIYCECGFNAARRTRTPRPTREEVSRRLEETLRNMGAEGKRPDVITFAGNGEPTLHPDFPAIIDDTRRLRDALCPEAKISVLSNATTAMRPAVREALKRVDNNILKLDTVDPDYISRIDRPQGHYDVGAVIEALAAFEGHAIVQTMFMTGSHAGRDVDNTGAAYVEPWIEALKRIAPQQVMIYTIDRETPEQDLRKASPEQLDAIAARLHEEGFLVSVSY